MISCRNYDKRKFKRWPNVSGKYTCTRLKHADDSTGFYMNANKRKQLPLEYSFPRETVNTIMIFYENMQAMVCSLNSDIYFSDIVAGVLQRVHVF